VLAKTDLKRVTSDHFAYDQYGDLRDAIITVYKCETGNGSPRRCSARNKHSHAGRRSRCLAGQSQLSK